MQHATPRQMMYEARQSIEENILDNPRAGKVLEFSVLFVFGLFFGSIVLIKIVDAYQELESCIKDKFKR